MHMLHRTLNRIKNSRSNLKLTINMLPNSNSIVYITICYINAFCNIAYLERTFEWSRTGMVSHITFHEKILQCGILSSTGFTLLLQPDISNSDLIWRTGIIEFDTCWLQEQPSPAKKRRENESKEFLGEVTDLVSFQWRLSLADYRYQ